MQRREFLTASSVALLGLAVQGGAAAPAAAPEPIIDIHQHVGYRGRSDNALIAHQRAMGATMTVLLPAGRPVVRASTHEGVSNGLQAQCLGNEACCRLARAHPKTVAFGANEVPDLQGAIGEIERYLQRGARVIGEQKFGLEMHWQFQMYNYGFERFAAMLEKYPTVTFIGHAQTWWANIDRDHHDQTLLYPKGPVTAGGWTDRYLTYPNMYGDLSAGSGLNALTRDEEFTRDFLTRHQDKLLFGSDCTDAEGRVPLCQGAQTIDAIRRLSLDKRIERKLLYDNAKALLRL